MARFNTLLFLSASLVSWALSANKAAAQVSFSSENKRGSVYISIGANSPSYSPSTINITQASANNDYTLSKVSADNKNSSSSGILSCNFRVGYYFNYNQDFALELNYDPTSYHIVDGQNVHMTGTFEGAKVDKTLPFSAKSGYYYYINGANLVMVNIVKRFGLYQNKLHTLYFDVMAKAGAGPAMPHVINSLDGKVSETPQFQVTGWNAGLEAAVRMTIRRHVFLEVGPKYDYASYGNLSVYSGSATQKISTIEIIGSIGYTFSTTKHNPRFEKKFRTRRVLTIAPINPNPEDGGGSNDN